MEQKKLLISLSIIVSIVLIWSLINPITYTNWLLESFPVLIGAPILFFTYKKFRFSNVVYVLIALEFIVLMVGGHYTYAKNPLFEWIKITFDLQRNYYDRLGHFMQGFVPVMIAREFLLRKSTLKRGKLLIFVLISIVLAITAAYELLEWSSTLTLPPEEGLRFLGSQGDLWDAQKDMLLALIGGVGALILLSRIQDKQIKELKL